MPNTGFYVSAPLPAWQPEKRLGRIGAADINIQHRILVVYFGQSTSPLMLCTHIFNLYAIRLASRKETRQNRGLLLIYSEYTPIKRGLMF